MTKKELELELEPEIELKQKPELEARELAKLCSLSGLTHAQKLSITKAPCPTVGAWRRRKIFPQAMTESINKSVNDEAVYRTVPAAPGLLNTHCR